MDVIARVVLVGLGSAAIIVMAVDFFTTTLSLGGTTGMLTARLSEGVWKLALRTRNRRVLQATGPVMLLLVALVWLLLAAIGWTLVFRGLQPASTGGGAPVDADWADLVLSFFDTFLGISTEELRDDGVTQWQVVRRVMVVHGIATLSLTLAWILPVVRAVAHKRAVALRIAALGTDSQDILVRSWNGEDFGDLNLFLIELAAELSLLGQLHLAYPVLHYYHSQDDRASLSRQVAVLDDAVSLLAHDVDPAVVPTSSSVTVLRSVLTDFLGMLEVTFIPRYGGELPSLATGRLEEAGVPLRGDADDHGTDERRRLLIGYLLHDGADPASIEADTADLGTGTRPDRHRKLLPSPTSWDDRVDTGADPDHPDDRDDA